jgi:hypothetical protein
MGFKFLKDNVSDQPDYITQERFNELVGYQLNMNVHNPLTVDNRPAVFLNLNRERDTISDDEWNHILKRQRESLIQYMWEQGMIIQTVISQDQYGLTLRTEINF